MRQSFIIVFLFCISAIQVFSQSSIEVRFDGLYQSGTNGDSRYFLRFYSDSTVISVTSTGQATDVIKWFKKPFNDQGKYEINGNKIYFTTTSSYGTVVYEGIIDSEYKITLTVISLINGHKSKEIYYFIKF